MKKVRGVNGGPFVRARTTREWLDTPDGAPGGYIQPQQLKERDGFRCNFSKMVVKKDGRMRVDVCTLVDDDEDDDLGGSLSEAMRIRVLLKHHRCYTCFAAGASCSELE